jgi:uncharacterized membrane protein
MSSNIVKKKHGQQAEIEIRERVTLQEGPLPAPEVLEKYKEVCPESVKIIFDLTKDYQNHVIEMDLLGARTARTDTLLSLLLVFTGQLSVLIVSMSGFVLAYLRPELGVAGFSFSATICSYLIWWKTRGQPQEKKE